MDIDKNNADPRSLTIDIRVVPRASKSEVVGWHDGALKLRIAAPPVDGAANDEVVRTLAKYFGVAKRSIEIIGGMTSKQKRVRIDDIDRRTAEALLSAA